MTELLWGLWYLFCEYLGAFAPLLVIFIIALPWLAADMLSDWRDARRARRKERT